MPPFWTSLKIFKEFGKNNITVIFSCTGPEPKPELGGDTRTFRVWLDPNQYQIDMSATEDGSEVSYNVLLLCPYKTKFFYWHTRIGQSRVQRIHSSAHLDEYKMGKDE